MEKKDIERATKTSEETLMSQFTEDTQVGGRGLIECNGYWMGSYFWDLCFFADAFLSFLPVPFWSASGGDHWFGGTCKVSPPPFSSLFAPLLFYLLLASSFFLLARTLFLWIRPFICTVWMQCLEQSRFRRRNLNPRCKVPEIHCSWSIPLSLPRFINFILARRVERSSKMSWKFRRKRLVRPALCVVPSSFKVATSPPWIQLKAYT